MCLQNSVFPTTLFNFTSSKSKSKIGTNYNNPYYSAISTTSAFEGILNYYFTFSFGDKNFNLK